MEQKHTHTEPVKSLNSLILVKYSIRHDDFSEILHFFLDILNLGVILVSKKPL